MTKFDVTDKKEEIKALQPGRCRDLAPVQQVVLQKTLRLPAKLVEATVLPRRRAMRCSTKFSRRSSVASTESHQLIQAACQPSLTYQGGGGSRFSRRTHCMVGTSFSHCT